LTPEFHYGGQAVIEGVMVRGRRCLSLAVRRSDGAIISSVQKLSPSHPRLRNIPGVRGVVILTEALVLGIKSLLYSAKVYAGEEEEIPPGLVWGSLIIGIAFGVGLFIVAPFAGVHLLRSQLPDRLALLAEGLLRLGLFIGYLKLIALWPDVRRVFAYHGAEHKAINALELNGSLGSEEVSRASTIHPRCSTSLILTVLVIAIFAFALLGRLPLWLGAISRLLLLPIIASLSYEIIRWGGRHRRLGRMLLAPGLWLQSLTTADPDEAQIEVAIAAVRNALDTDAAF